MAERTFHKYEGLGNDLVFFEGNPDAIMAGIEDRASWMTAVCDRHLGVGADGIMFVDLDTGEGLAARIAYFNADGSPAEMCGNGLRCACLFMHHLGRVPVGEWFSVLMSGAGVRRCRIESVEGDRGVVKVEIGTPVRGRGASGEPRSLKLSVGGHEVDLTPLSVSNPHAVTFQPMDRAAMETLGPAIEHHPEFPGRVNVEFASVAGDGGIDLVVWERGCGFTQACGSGACATAVAAIWQGHAVKGEPVLIRLPGGPLHVTLDEDDVIWLEGAARRAFSGTLDPANFS